MVNSQRRKKVEAEGKEERKGGRDTGGGRDEVPNLYAQSIHSRGN